MKEFELSKEEKIEFLNYCKKYGWDATVESEFCWRIRDTTHFKLYCLSLRVTDLKTEVRNALPKWLKWIIK